MSCSLGVESAGLPCRTHAIKPQTLSNYDWSGETVEVSASVTFTGQIGSSIFVGVLLWAKSVGSFTPSRNRQTPTGSSPEAGPQDLSLLWSYDHVSLCCFGLGNLLAFCCSLVSIQSLQISVSLVLPLSCDSGPVCLLSTPKLDSKDFLTDPAVYSFVSKFQKF